MFTALPTVAASAVEPDPLITFQGSGFGHGVGMSQYGAYGRAVEGQEYDTILGAYYTGATIGTLGIDVVDPEQKHIQDYQFSSLVKDDNSVHLKTCNWGNPTTSTDSNQGICLEIKADTDTELAIDVNGLKYRKGIGELITKSDSFYLEKFLSGAIHVHRFVPESRYKKDGHFSDTDIGESEDFYYVRVRQRNGQWAYSSPVWVQERG